MESQTDSEEYQNMGNMGGQYDSENEDQNQDFSASEQESDLNKPDYSEDEEDQEQQLEEEEQQIQETLKLLPFETLLKLKKESKENRQQILKNYSKKDSKNKKDKFEKERIIKRKNEDAPIERDAKIQVSRKQVIFAPKRQRTRDPRFDNLSGKLNNQSFNKAYNFLDEMKQGEKNLLEKELKKKKYNSEQKGKMKQELGRIKQDIKVKENTDDRQKVKSQFKKKAIQSIQKGLKPHFAKKSEQKDAELKIKFDKLEKQGKLEKVLDKKRKQRADKLMHGYYQTTKKQKFE